MAGRPTKYAHVTANLPKLDAIEPERRQVVDAVKAEILGPGAATDPPLILLRENMEEASDAVENAIAVAKRATRGRRYASEFARGYAEVRGMKDALKAWESSVQVLLDAYEEL